MTNQKFTYTFLRELCGIYLSIILGVPCIKLHIGGVLCCSYRQLKASESCDHDDEDDVEITQRILELSHVCRLSHLSEVRILNECIFNTFGLTSNLVFVCGSNEKQNLNLDDGEGEEHKDGRS